MLGTHASTVARRLDVLENTLGYRLIERKPDGLSLTDAGRKLLPKAREIEEHVAAFSRDAMFVRSRKPCDIIIQAPEGLGIHWLSKQNQLNATANDVTIDLICSDTLPDLGSETVDISVQYQPTENPDNVQYALGFLNILPFASRGYIADFGMPICLDDLPKHRLISQIGPHGTVDLWRSNFKDSEFKKLEFSIRMRTNSGSAQYYAVMSSVGIGGLPTYGVIGNNGLVPIDIGIRQLIPIYMVYRKDRFRNRVAFDKAVRWTKQIFNPRSHPYFSDT